MTDEEKAEEYSDKLDLVKERNPELKTNDDFIKQAYLDGLAEGRKELEKENEELKAKLKGFENGDVAWQGDMDKTIKQNLELKAQIENYKLSENESKEIIAELKMHCKAVDDVNFLMRNCWNCSHSEEKECDCKNNSRWELNYSLI